MKDINFLLKRTRFPYLWGSQILSQLTINIMNFLLILQLFKLTESTIATSILWICYAVPAIIIGPIAAASVDMIDRRKILMFTNLLQSLVIFVFYLTHTSSVFLLYGVVMAYSFLNQFYLPAESASMPSLVKKNVYPQANSLFFMTQQAALIVGFGLAGIINQILGFEVSILLCSILLFLAFISVTFLPKFDIESEIPRSIEEALKTFFDKIFEGYYFLKNNRKVYLPFLILLCLQVSLAIIVVNIPLIARDILNIKLELSGIIIVAPAGLGAIFGALIIPKILKKGFASFKLIRLSIMSMIFMIFILVFVVDETGEYFRLLTGIFSIIIIGFNFVSTLIPAQTLIQEHTPVELRGRVFGNFWFITTIATIFPVILSGAISEIFNIRILLVFIMGIFIVFLINTRNERLSLKI